MRFRALLALVLCLLTGCPVFAAPRTGLPPVIRFSDRVDAMTVAPVIQNLRLLAQTEPIVILELNTPGGEVGAGFELAKTIETVPAKVVCVVDGEADSMGFYILQSCDVRIMTSRSFLMAHEASSGAQGKERDLQSAADMLRVLRKAMAAHEARRLHMTPAEFDARIHETDWWMDADEALEIGAVDSVAPSVLAAVQGLFTVPAEPSEVQDAGQL